MNPYAPPQAELADSTDNSFMTSATPWQVSRAAWLIAASLALGVLKIMLVPTPGPLWLVFATIAVLLAFTAAIAKGKNWARITFTVMFGLGLPSVFFIREQLLREGSISVLVMAVQTVLQLTAVVLLFLPASNGWFRGRRETAKKMAS